MATSKKVNREKGRSKNTGSFSNSRKAKGPFKGTFFLEATFHKKKVTSQKQAQETLFEIVKNSLNRETRYDDDGLISAYSFRTNHPELTEQTRQELEQYCAQECTNPSLIIEGVVKNWLHNSSHIVKASRKKVLKAIQGNQKLATSWIQNSESSKQLKLTEKTTTYYPKILI